MSLSIKPYLSSDELCWDEFCVNCHQATFLHTRKFLGYHGDKFIDASLVIEMDSRIIGLFPAAVNPNDNESIVSHPGLTYGGILHNSSLKGELLVSCLSLIKAHYASLGFSQLTYKAVPKIYHQAPVDDDLYAIFRLNGLQKRVDLSCAIDLDNQLIVSERRRRGLKKAIKSGVVIEENCNLFSGLWDVLTDNLIRKHGVSPVHNLSEILSLVEKFPNNIKCVCALYDGNVIAGVVLFVTPSCIHSQYIASSEFGYSVSALDMVFDYCITTARQLGKRWFDFGISTEDSGMVLNDGLYKFKSEFGGAGIVHQFYEFNLLGESDAN